MAKQLRAAHASSEMRVHQTTIHADGSTATVLTGAEAAAADAAFPVEARAADAAALAEAVAHFTADVDRLRAAYAADAGGSDAAYTGPWRRHQQRTGRRARPGASQGA